MNSLQLKASDPFVSTWVSASAGTGKTKILTDRVLRLLLTDVAFSKILCLTFTNAAAGEMKERIANSLAKWSKFEESELKSELRKTLGRSCTNAELSKAKTLYNLYLKSEERINIQTIHSFCHSLLKRFPLEAGVSPSFKIIDETKSHFILQQIKKKLPTNIELEPINKYLTENLHELTIDDILSEIVQQRINFSNKVDNLYEESQKIISKLQKKLNHKYNSILETSIIHNIVGFNSSIAQVKNFFLTSTGKKKKRIVTKKIAPVGSSLYSDLERMQHQIYLLDQEERAYQLEHYSSLLSMLGSYILESYESYKKSKGLLDYNDLIIYVSKLLRSSDAREWVLYKLDGGIDHLLVDEAQDTSSDQWQIVDAMIQEFYAGDSGDDKKNRTIFVVGDEKQSIFSFQGADVDSFSHMNQLLKHKMVSGGNKFKDISLEISYRSAQEILDIVHLVFDKISNIMPGLFTTKVTKLKPFRTQYSGSVELWPLCTSDDYYKEFWPIINSDSTSQSAKTDLAKKISYYIKDQLATGRILPSTGKKIAPDDFMILFRKRDDFTDEVEKALKEENLATTGLDRIFLKENLAVLDLLSAGKFVINNHDDLNLASLLKSPLIGLSEKELYTIATTRDESSIWNHIQLLAKTDKKYQNIFDQLEMFTQLFQTTNISHFFQHIVDILGYREVLNTVCGPDSNDAIDELLYSCIEFSEQNDTNLQSFIFWLENYNVSIKRDSSTADKIKIMTLHASKGLQSPYVILCDTTSIPSTSERFILDQNKKALSAQNSAYTPEYFQDLKTANQNKIYAEYLRLLYVGMTRAEDHLIVCGFQGSKKLSENCWYKLVHSAMVSLARNTGPKK